MLEILGVKASAQCGDLTAEEPEDTGPKKRTLGKGRLTHIQDPELRSAIEKRALHRAIEHYKALGATDVVKLGKPYDIKLSLNTAERHVEVKGSSPTGYRDRAHESVIALSRLRTMPIHPKAACR